MPIVTLTFPHRLNVSVQIGDVAYYTKQSTAIGAPRVWAMGTTPHITSAQSDIVMIGEIIDILQWDGTEATVTCDMPLSILNTHGLPTNGVFIMFSKDNKVNLSSILGYYANVKFVNDSREEGELFSVGTEVFESSK